MSVIEELRHAIEKQHAEAMEALRVLSKYLSSTPNQPATNGEVKPPAPVQPIPIGEITGSNRDRVLDIIKTDWATADEISERTGLSVKQVRGVLNAPRLGDDIDRQVVNGKLQFHWRSDSPQETPS
jgi:hypothetical protein